MTIQFLVRDGGFHEDDVDEFLSVWVSEQTGGLGFQLDFQCSMFEPDTQDIGLKMDTYCLCTADQGTSYGSVQEVSLRAGLLRVVLTPESLSALGLTDTVVETELRLPQSTIEEIRGD